MGAMQFGPVEKKVAIGHILPIFNPKILNLILHELFDLFHCSTTLRISYNGAHEYFHGFIVLEVVWQRRPSTKARDATWPRPQESELNSLPRCLTLIPSNLVLQNVYKTHSARLSNHLHILKKRVVCITLTILVLFVTLLTWTHCRKRKTIWDHFQYFSSMYWAHFQSKSSFCIF